MTKLFIILSGVFLFITAVCGMWMYSQEVVENSSKVFHMSFAFLTVISSIISMILLAKKK